MIIDSTSSCSDGETPPRSVDARSCACVPDREKTARDRERQARTHVHTDREETARGRERERERDRQADTHTRTHVHRDREREEGKEHQHNGRRRCGGQHGSRHSHHEVSHAMWVRFWGSGSGLYIVPFPTSVYVYPSISLVQFLASVSPHLPLCALFYLLPRPNTAKAAQSVH